MPRISIGELEVHTEDMDAYEMSLFELLDAASQRLRIVEDEIAVCYTALASAQAEEFEATQNIEDEGGGLDQ